ncbi:serine-rich adhesin for platelets-like [Linepithema humile]|uniref:serine-rich adhesin for platelets-like n=1 Tax=Linepithema humile TaxID=83485 RepID=UPI00351E2760
MLPTTTTTTSTTVSTTVSGSSRKRYRRPSRVSSTESSRTNELDDSPIIRITQGGARRNLSFRSRTESEEENNNKVTNIRVFKRPTVNRELYDRTKYTKKKDNVEEPLGEVDESSQKGIESTSKVAEASIAGAEIERSDSLNIVDQETVTIDSVVESNTLEPIYTAKSIAAIGATTAFSGKIDYTSARPKDAVATTTAHIETHEFNPGLVILVTEPTDVEGTSAAPRKRKVLLRRRPVSSSTANAIEDEEKSQVTRRRKVTRRKRPEDTLSSTKIIFEKETSLLPDSTTPIGEESTTDRTEFTKEMEDSTLAITETTLSGDYNPNGFTKVTLETPAAESTTIPEEATDSLSTISTINTYDEEFRSTNEMDTESATIESTLATATIDNTESDAFTEETSIPSTENLSTREQITTVSLTPEPDSAAKPSFESRYARKKYIRKNPASFSENATNRYSSASTENSSLEALSRRRNNLFSRRPVSSTTVNAPRDDVKYEEEEQEEKETGAADGSDLVKEIVEDTTLSDKPASTNDFSVDSAEFWRHYTTASSRAQITYPTIPDDESPEDREVTNPDFVEDNTYRSTSIATRKPEIRPRYKVPVILKRPFDPEEALSPKRHPLDSAPEESEKTPETREARLRQSGFRQPRTRYKLQDRDGVGTNEETTPSGPESTSIWQHFRTRLYSRRPSTTSTEATVTETLIPARKFNYAADAFHRKQQSLRTTTTPRSNDPLDSQNLIDPYHARVTKPSVTRLVTSVTESGTTERQKILIKTKYSSLTSTTRIPADQFSPTTPLNRIDDDESVNEIRRGVERSTLPIEGEFSNDGRFTTESHESSTIEIESVFSNLIAGKSAAK